MKPKRQEKTKSSRWLTPEQKKFKQKGSELTDFYELLDTLLPQKSELLCDILEKKKKELQEILVKKEDESDYLLELEKAKNNCLQELLQIFIEQYQRASADYANFQKRAAKQTADAIAYEKEKIIKALLPALDNFESALGRLQNVRSAENADVLVKGIQIIYDQMLDILKSHGVEHIKALGEKFDPALHEVIMQKAEPAKEENIVLEEFQKGYKLNGRVIRPSRVIINKLPSEQEISQQEHAKEEQTTDESTNAEDKTADT
jgi:molecular chaperone GrpE